MEEGPQSAAAPSHKRRHVLIALGTGVAILIAWLGGLVWYAGLIPDQVPDRSRRTDAIVVLTGGRRASPDRAR